MPALKLASWDVASTRQKLTELIEPLPQRAAWLGAVSASDQSKLLEFIAMAKAGDLHGLSQFQQIGGDLIYAVLLKLNDNKWKLAIIESPYSPSSNERVIYSAIIHVDVPIEISTKDLSSIEKYLKKTCKVSFLDVIKELFRNS